jgi:hypothetical protein
MKKSNLAYFGGMLLLALSILGGTANIAYWLYVKKSADGFEETLFQMATSIREMTAECERQKSQPRSDLLGEATSTDPELAQNLAPSACDRVASSELRRDTITHERDRQRSRAWEIVRYMAVWAVMGIAGVLVLVVPRSA